MNSIRLLLLYIDLIVDIIFDLTWPDLRRYIIVHSTYLDNNLAEIVSPGQVNIVFDSVQVNAEATLHCLIFFAYYSFYNTLDL